ncbi:hypothetical protein BT63DRAFT_457437 [Microthyrium microscopicum]|uniref:Uncharacterized protein n=1 Tax=Microthyrium microscopicum TaxID=703497 RepID=A0A6A6U4X2_9PEZI|nr:hypothetical protein BT63DRAFT_457437 [Microthyrium microscopicum]
MLDGSHAKDRSAAAKEPVPVFQLSGLVVLLALSGIVVPIPYRVDRRQSRHITKMKEFNGKHYHLEDLMPWRGNCRSSKRKVARESENESTEQYECQFESDGDLCETSLSERLDQKVARESENKSTDEYEFARESESETTDEYECQSESDGDLCETLLSERLDREVARISENVSTDEYECQSESDGDLCETSLSEGSDLFLVYWDINLSA